jgi:hypothetical protein
VNPGKSGQAGLGYLTARSQPPNQSADFFPNCDNLLRRDGRERAWKVNLNKRNAQWMVADMCRSCARTAAAGNWDKIRSPEIVKCARGSPNMKLRHREGHTFGVGRIVNGLKS